MAKWAELTGQCEPTLSIYLNIECLGTVIELHRDGKTAVTALCETQRIVTLLTEVTHNR